MSNEALTFIEIDIPVCALTYGISPCTASLDTSPPTGTDKCFHSKVTCQDLVNIDLQDVTLRFAAQAEYLPRDIDIVSANILDIDFSPSIVSLGENLGQRASLKVTFADHPHSDTGEGFDKYHAERSYNPFEQGTLWGKFRARQPFLRGRALRWIQGFVGQTLAEMETRHFFIESFDGPIDGKFSITAKDALKFLDGDRAVAPVLSNGFLSAPIDEDDLAFNLSPAGIGNSEYPASGIGCIGGNECVTFTRSADAVTIISRAQFGTVASDHQEGDRFQVVLNYTAQDPAVVLVDLLQTYTDLPNTYPDFLVWLEETATYFDRLITGTIVEPTPVHKLVSQIIQQCGFAMWDDNIAQKLRMQVLRRIVTDADLFSESHVVQPALLGVTEQPDKRISEIQIYYGIVDPTKGMEDADNYRAVHLAVDENAEEDYGKSRRVVFANWIPATGGSSIAERLGEIMLSRYRDPPRKFSFDLMRRNVPVPDLGGGYQLSWNNLQDVFGARENVPIQVTRLKPDPAIIHVEAEEMRFTAPASEDLSSRTITIDFNINDLDWKAAHDNVYPEIEAGQTCTLTITANAIVGSSNILIPALTVGDWPAGVTLNLVVLGRLQGKGGQGATYNGTGQNGGVALYTREAINLTDTNGEIFGGSGGGGSARVGVAGDTIGGGGGAGQLPGMGGAGNQPGSAGTTEAGGAAGGTGAGAGGGPGLSGGTGTPNPGLIVTAGGSPGLAIDGISFVTTIGAAGDRRGGTAN